MWLKPRLQINKKCLSQHYIKIKTISFHMNRGFEHVIIKLLL